MVERHRGSEPAKLEAALRALGSTIDYPPATGIAPAVMARISALPARRRGALALPASRRRRAIVALAAVALAAAIAAGARLSIGAVTIRDAASPGPASASMHAVALGSPATLDAAVRAVGASLAAPPALGRPDAVYLDRLPGGARVTLAWRPAPGLPAIPELRWGAVLVELRGESALATKTLYPSGAGVQRVEVDGTTAYWLTGRHELDVITSSGPRRSIVSGNVLLWTRGDLTLRLETMLPRAAAVDLAERASPIPPG